MPKYGDYPGIPDYMMQAMEEYVENGRPLGGFLMGLFSNDLFGAMKSADSNSVKHLRDYCMYVWNEVPHSCHGSREIVINWCKTRQALKNKTEEYKGWDDDV
jgi:hypothetical protein